MSNFKVGDKVRVVNNGMDYPMYKDFIQSVLLGKSSLWESGRRIKEGNVYRVLAAHTHTIMPSDGMLYAVENLKKTEVYIIGESGLELVESPLPRICYLLGGENTPLEIGEKFTVDDEKFKNHTYRISENGLRQHRDDTGGWWFSSNEEMFTFILNHPEKIIRKPKIEFSDDEKAMMREFVKAGFAWIARDKDDTLAVFTGKPKLVGYDDDTYMHNSGDDGCNIPNNLFPQITFENSPIRMEEYL